MVHDYSVPLTKLVKEFQLDVIYPATDYDAIRLTVEDVARPGLQLAGYFDHFEPMRLQVMGNVEISYLEKLEEQGRLAAYDRLFSYKIPALLLARGFAPGQDCLQMAKKHNIQSVILIYSASDTQAADILTLKKKPKKLKRNLKPRK